MNAADMVRIVEAIESDYVQVYFDTGNAAGIGYNIVQEIEGLGKHIVQIHIKDHPSTLMLGEGNIDFEAAINALKKVDFRGYLMLETPSTNNSVVASVKNLTYIKCVVDG